MAARTSASVNVGKSARISAVVAPSARLASTVRSVTLDRRRRGLEHLVEHAIPALDRRLSCALRVPEQIVRVLVGNGRQRGDDLGRERQYTDVPVF
jgi:hypothetical protein